MKSLLRQLRAAGERFFERILIVLGGHEMKIRLLRMQQPER